MTRPGFFIGAPHPRLTLLSIHPRGLFHAGHGRTDLITRGERRTLAVQRPANWDHSRTQGPSPALLCMRGIVGSTWDNGDSTARYRLPGKNFLQVSGVRGTRGLKRKRQP